MLTFAREVEIIEVGPRDGLQSLPRTVSTEDKLDLLDLLADAGFRTIEATAFVRPDVVPQLADAAEIMTRLRRRDGVSYRALVPNRRGASRAIEAGVDEILGLITTSDPYNLRNANMSVARNLDVLDEVAAVTLEAGTALTVAVGLAWFSPDEGDTPPDRVLAIVDRVMSAGARRLYLATSVGMDGPREVHELCALIGDRFPELSLGLHLHNANGMALANALAGMNAGVRWFEGSICGIGGGIAMRRGAPDSGNVASEDLVAFFQGMGVATGIAVEDVREAAQAAATLLDIAPRSSLLAAGTKADVRRA